jgi:hypothetical protein
VELSSGYSYRNGEALQDKDFSIGVGSEKEIYEEEETPFAK